MTTRLSPRIAFALMAMALTAGIALPPPRQERPDPEPEPPPPHPPLEPPTLPPTTAKPDPRYFSHGWLTRPRWEPVGEPRADEDPKPNNRSREAERRQRQAEARQRSRERAAKKGGS